MANICFSTITMANETILAINKLFYNFRHSLLGYNPSLSLSRSSLVTLTLLFAHPINTFGLSMYILFTNNYSSSNNKNINNKLLLQLHCLIYKVHHFIIVICIFYCVCVCVCTICCFSFLISFYICVFLILIWIFYYIFFPSFLQYI